MFVSSKSRGPGILSGDEEDNNSTHSMEEMHYASLADAFFESAPLSPPIPSARQPLQQGHGRADHDDDTGCCSEGSQQKDQHCPDLFTAIVSLSLVPDALTSEETTGKDMVISQCDISVLQLSLSPDISLERVASALADLGSSQLVLARCIFRWITANIAMETDARRKRAPESSSPIDILRTRRASPEGFANLFTALADVAGLSSTVVVGFAGGWTVHKNSDGSGVPDCRGGGGAGLNTGINAAAVHYWNVVTIEGRRGLVDCAWGAGYMQGDDIFTRDFQAWYFFPDPRLLIYTHMPFEERHQLLLEPLSRAQQVALPQLSLAGVLLGVRTVSHHGVAVSDDNGCVTLRYDVPAAARLSHNFTVEIIRQQAKASPDRAILDGSETIADLTSSVHRAESPPLAGGEEQMEVCRRAALVHWIGSVCGQLAVHVRCPGSGSYALILYGGPRGQPVEELMRQHIEAEKITHTKGSFPKTYPLPPGVSPPVLRAPLRDILPRNSPVSFVVYVPGAASVGVLATSTHAPDQWTPLACSTGDSVFRGVAVLRADGVAYLTVMYKENIDQALRAFKFAVT